MVGDSGDATTARPLCLTEGMLVLCVGLFDLRVDAFSKSLCARATVFTDSILCEAAPLWLDLDVRQERFLGLLTASTACSGALERLSSESALVRLCLRSEGLTFLSGADTSSLGDSSSVRPENRGQFECEQLATHLTVFELQQRRCGYLHGRAGTHGWVSEVSLQTPVMWPPFK